MEPTLLRHLRGEKIGHFPVWMMRQAGRYLPSYRALREGRTFWDMATNPELAAQVTLLPQAELEVDALIFFSDILTPPYGMGIPIEIKESIGPCLDKPLGTLNDFEVFSSFDPQKHTAFVGKALQIVREQAADEKAVLGFAGAPWTLGAYLIEGNLKSKQFYRIKEWMYRDPKGLAQALQLLADATADYLIYQINSGANGVQLFDSWIAEMPHQFFVQHYLPILNSIFDKLAKTNAIRMFYSKQSQHLIAEFRNLNINVLSVDSSMSLGQFETLTDAKFSLQGNLDPVLLLTGTEALVRQQTRLLVQQAMKLQKPAIMNLGHGILPKTPVPNAKAFIEEARVLWT